MAALGCGVYVNITMVMLSSHAQDEDSKYACQETAELIMSTMVALSGGTEPKHYSQINYVSLYAHTEGVTNCSCEVIFCQ